MSSRYTPCEIIPYSGNVSYRWICSICCLSICRYECVCSGCQKKCCEDCFKDFYIYFRKKTEKIISQFRFCSKKCIIDNLSHEELSIVEIFKKDQGDQKYKIEIKIYEKSKKCEYQFVRLTKSTKVYYK